MPANRTTVTARRASKGSRQRSRVRPMRTRADAPSNARLRVPRPDRRTWLVVGIVGLLVAAGLGLWVIVLSGDGGETVAPEVQELVTDTADARAELGNLTAELQDLILTASQGAEFQQTAVGAAGDLVERADALTASFLALPAFPDASLTKQLYTAAARSLAESARVLSLSDVPADPALQNQLVNSAGRVLTVGGALRDSADESLVALQAGTSFVALPGDVPTSAEMAEFPPAASLDGFPEDRAIPDPVAEEAIADNDEWADQAATILGDYAAAIGTMGDDVRAFEAGGPSSALRESAVAWYDAATAALEDLSALRRPDTLQDADVAVRDALWLATEAARALGAAATQPDLSADLLAAGKALRLTSDELWAAAAGRVDRDTGATLPGPPASGFDPALVDPDERMEPVPTTDGSGAPGSDTSP